MDNAITLQPWRPRCDYPDMKRLAITHEGTPELRKVILVSSILRKDRRKDEERLYQIGRTIIIIIIIDKASKSQSSKV